MGAGNSRRGRVFKEIMNKELYVEILEDSLLPCIHNTYLDNDYFLQDAKAWMEEKGVNWWKTPPDYPDLENLWHELKEVKPEVKQKLIDGILAFWRAVDVDKCNKHLRRVTPKVIELNVCATGIIDCQAVKFSISKDLGIQVEVVNISLT